MTNTFKQALENLPQEILAQPRFFQLIGNDKGDTPKGWNEPDNQKLYTELEGLVGFDTSGHGKAADYLFLDFDHIFNDKGEFFNEVAQTWFENTFNNFKTYCELSVSKHGAHMLALPTVGKFPKVTSGRNGRIYFDDDKKSYVEIFYQQKSRYCLFTGDVFRCEPNTPIAQGEGVDEWFKVMLDFIAVQNQKAAESTQKSTTKATTTPEQNHNTDAELIFSSTNSHEYDLFRAPKMLDCINPADHVNLPDSDWLAVISSCRNIGIDYATVDNFNRRDPERYNETENLTRWNSDLDPSFGIETLHGIAKRFGYEEKAAYQEWRDLNPDSKPRVVHRPEPMSDDGEEKFAMTQSQIKSCPVNLRIPNDFIFAKTGIYQIVETQKGTKYFPATKTPIVPTKIFFEPTKGTDEYEVAIFSRGKWRRMEVDAKTLGDARALNILCDCGALIIDNSRLKNFFAAIIALNPNMPTLDTYNKTGWTNDDCTEFIYPHAGAPYIVRRAGFDFNKIFKPKGDPSGWRRKFVEVTNAGGAIACACFGVALSATIAEPILGFNPSAHLLGKSGGGKTALLKFIASAFGNPRELIRTFAATNKNRLLVSSVFNGLPTFFDELETGKGKAAEEATTKEAYDFYEGTGNQANKRNGTAREVFKFRASRLTTGERHYLKQNDLRGAFKRVLPLVAKVLSPYEESQKSAGFLPDDLAADLHFFSESNFGHFGKIWADYVTEHLQNIQEQYELFAKMYTPLKKYEPTHLKMLAAAIVSTDFFAVATGIKSEFDKAACIRNMRAIVDTLPTSAELDDTARAIEALSSHVASHEKSFTHEEKDGDTSKTVEIGAWGTVCFGKIFDTGEVAIHPTELKRILEDELHFASAEKLINEWNEQGFLITDKGRITHVVRLGTKTYRVIHFKAGIISTDIDSAEIKHYEDIGAL